ncbi:extracellular solute-binding protein [Paenibacillus glycanilyticus]|uniref:ABC transporter substrate-binding protein n=1 Tax=Paenibacillus glycanilyticus TaxID=126569 RepID=UPI00203DA1AE|nr:extracellular solute-binding protein [Paenibacillus glycanilyticus]MCM3629348.1 extracellular solute-binding protein [Paenibacillus glycanilyticus]
MRSIASSLLSMAFLLAACSSNNVSGPGSGSSSPGNSSEIVKQPVDGVSTDGHVKLTFATYYLSDKMQAAIEKFEELYPNVEILLQATPTSGKDLDEVMAYYEKFVTGVNTAVLAGKGPDLIEMDELPMEAYTKRGLLADLNELMAGDSSFRPQDYFVNILNNAKLGNGLYGMPLYFSLVGLVGDSQAIGKTGVQIDDSSWSWNDFLNTARQLQQQGEFKNAIIGEPSILLSEMAAENFTHLVKEKNGERKFDSAAFIQLIDQVKEMVDDGLLFDMLKDGGGRGSAATQNAHAYFSENTISSFGTYLFNDLIANPTLYAKPHPQDMGAGGYFSTYGSVGISANSPHKQEAWNFIRFLMESEVQHLDDASGGHGFPINMNAYDKQVEQLKSAGTIQTESHPDTAVDVGMLDLLKKDLKEAVHWVHAPSNIDKTIQNESKAFFSGQKTAEQVAKIVQSKVNLILNE